MPWQSNSVTLCDRASNDLILFLPPFAVKLGQVTTQCPQKCGSFQTGFHSILEGCGATVEWFIFPWAISTDPALLILTQKVTR